MKKPLLACAVVIWTCGQVLASGSLSFPDVSRGMVAEPGDVQASHAFAFTNPGDGPIIITEVKTSCGCTTAVVKGEASQATDEGQERGDEASGAEAPATAAAPQPLPMTFGPGESGRVVATFVFGDRVGEQTKHIRVHWREADGTGSDHVTTLTLNVTIPEVLRITPRLLYWSPTDAKEAKTTDITIEEGQSVRLTGATSSTADVTVELQPIAAPGNPSGEGRRYTLKVTPVVTDRPTRSVITLTTDNPKIPAARLTLHARLVPARGAGMSEAKASKQAP